MSFTAVGDLTIYGNATTLGVYTFTGAAIPAGSLVVIGWDGNVDSLTVAATDNSTQPGDPNVWFSAGTMSGGTFCAGVHYCLRITRALLTTDTLTLTLGGSVTASRRSAFGSIYTPGNGNAQLDKYQSVANDTTSPVGPTASTGTLSTTGELAITFGFVKNGAVATGSANASTNMGSPALHSEANSGGTVTIVATRMADANLGTTTAMTGSWTYTGITVGACAIMSFSDVLQTWSPSTARARTMIAANANLAARPGSQAMSAFGVNAVVPDVVALTATARRVENYRGSYSLNANAADQAVTPDTWTPTVTQRPGVNYKAPLASVLNVFDPAANTFADWTPPPARNRAQPNYSTPRSQAIQPPSFTLALDAWAQTTFGRATPYYLGSRALTISVFDPATNTFADWTPPALLSRSVKAYAPPMARTFGLFDPATNTFADWTPQPALSRAVPFYRAPAAFLARVYDQPVAVAAGDYAAAVLSRVNPYYRGSYSAVSNAADEAIAADAWASLIQSPPTPYYQGSRSRAIASADEPFADAWVPIIANRAPAYYTVPRATVIAVYDSLVTGSASVAQTYRQQQHYVGPPSLVINVFDPRANTFADWVPPALLSRSVPLYTAPRSSVASGTAVPFFGPEYVHRAQSRSVPFYRAPLSLFALGLDIGTIVLISENSGGGGEWVIWQKPNFPGNRPGAWKRFESPSFRKPSRQERRGY